MLQVFEPDFWWNWYKFYDKMDLSIQMRIIYNVKHCYVIRTFLPCLTPLVLKTKAKYLIYNQRKSTFILSQVFGICCHFHNFTMSMSQINTAWNRNHKFYNWVMRHKISWVHSITAWKVSVFGIILGRIFLHSEWIRRVSLRIQSECGKMWNNSGYGHLLRSAISDIKLLW